MDAFSFFRSVPSVAPGARHGFLQPIASESSLRIQLSGPQQPCQCPDSCTLHTGPAVRGERLQGCSQFLSHSHYNREGKRCMQYIEESWLGMPGRSEPAWKKRLRWKLKKGKVPIPSRQVLPPSTQNSKILLPARAQPLWETEHTLRLILIEINLASAIFHKVLQLIENQRKLF